MYPDRATNFLLICALAGGWLGATFVLLMILGAQGLEHTPLPLHYPIRLLFGSLLFFGYCGLIAILTLPVAVPIALACSLPPAWTVLRSGRLSRIATWSHALGPVLVGATVSLLGAEVSSRPIATAKVLLGLTALFVVCGFSCREVAIRIGVMPR